MPGLKLTGRQTVPEKITLRKTGKCVRRLGAKKKCTSRSQGKR